MKTRKLLHHFVISSGVLGIVVSHLSAQDQIYLANGTHIVGKQLSEDAKNAVSDLELENGIQVSLPRSQVKAVVVANDAVKFYLKNAGSAPDSLEAHQSIVNFLNKSGLSDIAEAHYQRIVELDPTNRSAWRVLNYNETSGGWVPSERYWKSKGMVRDGIRWRTPQDLAIATVLEERKRLSSEMKRKIDSSLRELNASGRRGEEAKRFFSELREAAALPHLVKIIEEEADPKRRLFLLNVIMQLDAKSLTTAVIKIMVRDDSIDVRDRCVDYLTANRSEVAIQQLLQYLTNTTPDKDRPEVINRAAEVLGMIGDERCIPRLIDVLITKHVVEVGPDTNTNVSFNGNGMNSFSPQSKKQRIEQQSRNNSVLGALNSLTDADLGYDREAWLEWYAHYSADTNLALRRDP